LIFGYKQRGQAAVDALNVFHPLSVQGGEMDTEGMDELERRSIEVQIREFGQCPKQLWTSPHPARVPLDSGSADSLNSNGNGNGKDKYAPIKKEVFENSKKKDMKMFTLDSLANCVIHRSEVTSIAVKTDQNSNSNSYFVYVGSKDGLLKVYSTRLDCAIRSFNVSSMALSSVYVVPKNHNDSASNGAIEEDEEIVVLIGSWDNNLYRFQLKNFDEKILFSFDDAVSCVLSDEHLITAGSWDGSVQLFYREGLKPLFLRFEFDSSVLCMGMKVYSDKTIYDQETMVGMEGFDGFLVVATKNNRLKLIHGTGTEKWDVEFESEAIGVVIISNDLVCLCTRTALCMFRLLDGVQVGKIQTSSAAVSAMTTVEGFDHIIVTGHEDSNIRVWDTSTGLQNGCYLIPSKTTKLKITSLTAHNDLLVAGTSDGSIYTYKINAS
jgi:WD40 repeat protein